ncbi:hypothetical protein H072_193 [Dactylellina haptotyla CBS 200.50]|uniref:F-box domain-containing protein n=1 Tax=Dactylellina haptotyla (strain CBS 200.50) TaxID=1284197 RepID=S8ASE2_DACHA|nr:hypothetical protein H072_193 [Dactylellina haptotyla CBS 200.50]
MEEDKPVAAAPISLPTEIHIQILSHLPAIFHPQCMRVCHLWYNILSELRRHDLGPLLSKLPNHIHGNILYRLDWEYHAQCMAASSTWASILQLKSLKRARYSNVSTNPPFIRLFQGYRCSMNFTLNLHDCGDEGENMNLISAHLTDGMLMMANPHFRERKMIALISLNLAGNPIMDDPLLDWEQFVVEPPSTREGTPDGICIDVLKPSEVEMQEITFSEQGTPSRGQVWYYKDHPQMKGLSLGGLGRFLVKCLKREAGRFDAYPVVTIEAYLENVLPYVFFELAVKDESGQRM